METQVGQGQGAQVGGSGPCCSGGPLGGWSSLRGEGRGRLRSALLSPGDSLPGTGIASSGTELEEVRRDSRAHLVQMGELRLETVAAAAGAAPDPLWSPGRSHLPRGLLMLFNPRSQLAGRGHLLVDCPRAAPVHLAQKCLGPEV